MCLLEAQAGLMNCFCPMEFLPELGFHQPPAVSCTLELVEFSVTSWLSCHSPSAAPKILSNLHWPPPQAAAMTVSAQLPTHGVHKGIWDTQHKHDPRFLGEWWQSWSSSGVTGPPCTEPSNAPGTSTQQTEDNDQLQRLPPMRTWAKQGVLVPGKVSLCSEQGCFAPPPFQGWLLPLSQQPSWADSSTPLSPPG